MRNPVGVLASGSGLTLTSTIFHVNKATQADHPKATVVTHTTGADTAITVVTSIATPTIARSNGIASNISYDDKTIFTVAFNPAMYVPPTGSISICVESYLAS